MNREAIHAALFALVSSRAGFITTSRKLRHWADVSPIEQPALFQAQGGETAIRTTGFTAKWELSVKLYLYAHTGGGLAPTSVLNPLVDAVIAALAPLPAIERQTLGGLVHDCRIDGTIETDEGVLGDQAVAIIPIRIITAT
jgi:hypothetical protein